MPLVTIFLFVLYLFGLGYSLTRFLPSRNFENFVIRLGVGLGAFSVLGLTFALLNIPLDWRIFLGASLILPLLDFCKNFKRFSFKFSLRSSRPDVHLILLLSIFVACLALYAGGSFTYPWLENGDPWHHAAGMKYVSIEKTLNVPAGLFQYIDPYPPGYDLLIGILHQSSPSLYWTIKFFNGLIISLGFLFFYFFVKEITLDRRKALAATYVLACIPCYLSHFIWAHSLMVTLFFPAFYLTLKAVNDRRFVLPGSIVFAGIFLTQPTQAIKFVILFFILFLVAAIVTRRKLGSLIAIFLIGTTISIILWWGPATVRSNQMQNLPTHPTHQAMASQKVFEPLKILKHYAFLFAPEGGTKTRSYHSKDYFFIPKINDINNPRGVGFIICCLAIIGFCRFCFLVKTSSSQKKIYYLTILGWFMFTFLGLNSATFQLPVGLFAFRFWMLLAIPITLLAAEGIIFLTDFFRNDRLRHIAFVTILLSIFFNAAIPKIRTNTARWPAGAGVYWTSREEMEGYIWLRHKLDINTKVFAFIQNFFVIGFDMRSDFWRPDYQKFISNAFQINPTQLGADLKELGYQYLIMGKRERNFFGEAKFNDKIENLQKHRSFDLVFTHADDVWIFKIL